jgi:hypothetical protein
MAQQGAAVIFGDEDVVLPDLDAETGLKCSAAPGQESFKRDASSERVSIA